MPGMTIKYFTFFCVLFISFLFFFFFLHFNLSYKNEIQLPFLRFYRKYSHIICNIIHVLFFLTPTLCHHSFFLYSPSFLCSHPSPKPEIYHHSLLREIIWALDFLDWLISLSMIFSRCIHLPSNAIILFFFMAK